MNNTVGFSHTVPVSGIRYACIMRLSYIACIICEREDRMIMRALKGCLF